MEPSEEELRAIGKGRRYEHMKETAGWTTLIAFMVKACNSRLEELQHGKELDALHTARLVDKWRASEEFYQMVVDEVESSIREKDRLEAELRGEGLIAPLMGPQPKET